MKIDVENLGFIARKLPEDLFNKLMKETETVIGNDDKIFVTGLTTTNIPKHYALTDTHEELTMFLMDMLAEYNATYPSYMKNIKFAKRNMAIAGSDFWINTQKKGEYLPVHTHDGIVSFVIWMKVPYDVAEETNQHDEKNVTSCLQFLYNDICGDLRTHDFKVSKDDVGSVIMFPSKLSHTVYPFYTVDDIRISISGCLTLDPDLKI